MCDAVAVREGQPTAGSSNRLTPCNAPLRAGGQAEQTWWPEAWVSASPDRRYGVDEHLPVALVLDLVGDALGGRGAVLALDEA